MILSYENHFWKISVYLKFSIGFISYMSSIDRQPKKSSDKKSLLIVSGILAAVGISLLSYMFFYTAAEEKTEWVKIIAITELGCIAETLDGFAVNIGQCQAQEGEMVIAVVDQKVKDRAAAMNPAR
jgi:flagellar basal body-associated protein FliL